METLNNKIAVAWLTRDTESVYQDIDLDQPAAYQSLSRSLDVNEDIYQSVTQEQSTAECYLQPNDDYEVIHDDIIGAPVVYAQSTHLQLGDDYEVIEDDIIDAPVVLCQSTHL